jgi:hypothetical protein
MSKAVFEMPRKLKGNHGGAENQHNSWDALLRSAAPPYQQEDGDEISTILGKHRSTTRTPRPGVPIK